MAVYMTTNREVKKIIIEQYPRFCGEPGGYMAKDIATDRVLYSTWCDTSEGCAEWAEHLWGPVEIVATSAIVPPEGRL